MTRQATASQNERPTRRRRRIKLTDPVFVRVQRREDVQHLDEPRFIDNVWPLHHLHQGEDRERFAINFERFPLGFRSEAKVLAYQCLNSPSLASEVRKVVRFVSPSTLDHCVRSLRRLAIWANRAGVRTFSDLTPDHLDAWAVSVRGEQIAWSTKQQHLLYIVRFWLHDVGQPTSIGFAKPRWVGRPIEEMLGSSPFSLVNRVDPIAPKVLRSLLQLCTGVVLSQARVLGTPLHDVSRFAAAALDVPSAQPKHFRAAAAMLISYLTGMRNQELMHLEHDGCTRVENDEGMYHFEIRGRHFKGVRDESGITDTSGAWRDQPWVTIDLAAIAYSLAEALSPHESLLFGREMRRPSNRSRVGEALTIGKLAKDLRGLVEAAQTGTSVRARQLAQIAATGPYPFDAFRRTLAWHIANEPDGDVAVGVQYGHLHSITSSGYIGRHTSGFPEELDLAFLESDVATYERIRETLANGEVLVGPAANRVETQVHNFASRWRGKFVGKHLTASSINRWKRSGNANLFDNPKAPCLCAFDPKVALCVQQADALTPIFGNCKPDRCKNVAMSRKQAEQRITRGDTLIRRAADEPRPMSQRSLEIGNLLIESGRLWLELIQNKADGSRE
jgi:hypothetical protein